MGGGSVRFNEKDRKHLEKANFEMGELCARVGNLEGKFDTGFKMMGSEFKDVKRSIGALPCSDHTNRIARIEGAKSMSDKIKFTAVAAISSVITFMIMKALGG